MRAVCCQASLRTGFKVQLEWEISKTRPEEMGQERVQHKDHEVRLKRDERECGQGSGPYQASLGGHHRERVLGSKCCGSCWRAFM